VKPWSFGTRCTDQNGQIAESFELSGEPELIRLLEPAHHWIPTGENLGHQPSLAFGELRLGKPSEFLQAKDAAP
jgi:hypothetical protein